MKSNVRTRRSWLTNIPIGLCIFFIVIGLLLGNVFVIVTWHQGRLIEKSEAIPIVAMFDSYVIHTSSKGSLNEVELRFGDYGKLYISAACFNADVERALDKLKPGDKAELLLHPVSNYIWEMQSDEGTILSFDDAKRRTCVENIVFSALGLFCYSMATMGVVSLFLQWKERRKAITKRS